MVRARGGERMTATGVDGWWRGSPSDEAIHWIDSPMAPPRVVAFQGERGAYGDLAIERLWSGTGAPMRERCWDFAGVIRAVMTGSADAALLPVHNAIVGAIPGVDEAIGQSGLTRRGEVTVPVRHCLLAQPDVTLTAITDVWSHPVALAQCGIFLAHHPHLSPRATYDTAGAAREVAARHLAHEAAIADERCAERYGLAVVARDVADRPDNATRFAILTRRTRADA
jgi:prephenate dehydratase